MMPGDKVSHGLSWPAHVEQIFPDDSEIYRMYVMESMEFGILYYSISSRKFHISFLNKISTS
jgi:hypothetical protein